MPDDLFGRDVTFFRSTRARSLVGLAGLAAALLAAVFWFAHLPKLAGKARDRDIAEAEAFADPATCLRCHADAAAGYARTGMAMAFSRPTAEDLNAKGLVGGNFFHPASGTHYQMLVKDGQLWQRRWQEGLSGQPENEELLTVDQVMGSGNHARTYLHRETDGRLIELPLAWYAEDGGQLGMNPGFDNAHPQTRRAITYECMFCHNGYPPTPDLTHLDYQARPLYTGELPQGIDCQRCHGPGQRHVTAAESPKVSLEMVRAAILNPARVNATRQMEVCEQCHLQTTSAPLPDHLRHFDQKPFSYRAGEPLNQAVSYFMRDPSLLPPNNFEIVSAPYRLRQSRCFRESQGRLTCETCHNPHALQKGPSATEYYANICLRCHATGLTTAVASGKHVASHECVSCHMPLRRTEDVVHVLMTDHLIQRNPPPAKELRKPLTELEMPSAVSYRGPVLPYPITSAVLDAEESLYTDVAQVVDDSNTDSGLVQLRAALQAIKPMHPEFAIALGDAEHRRGNQSAAIAAYRGALTRDDSSVRASRGLAVAQAEAGEIEAGIATVSGALGHDANNPVLWFEKGRIEVQAGLNSNGIQDLQRAIQLEPDFADAQDELGLALASVGQAAAAEKAFRASLQINPYDAGAEANLANLLAEQGRWPEAAFYLNKALRLVPQSIGYRSSLVSVLIQMQQWKRAEAEARTVQSLAPTSCIADLQLGEVLGATGSVAAAEAEFSKCLKISATNGHAHLDLGMAELQRGDSRDALQHLNLATQDPDPSVASRAQALLKRLATQ